VVLLLVAAIREGGSRPGFLLQLAIDRLSGALKNALDWVVGSGELIGKPIAVMNASARATHAWASLAGTLTVRSARVIRDASITVSLDGRMLDANGIDGWTLI
jgi:5,10-methylene-tetrahydrofolate dehydrogenase/methenyl tetrahydrofolate cyclohydrolase